MASDSIDSLIGVPFEWGGRGPGSYDCYGLLMKLYRDVRGIELPEQPAYQEVEQIAACMACDIPNWKEVSSSSLNVAVLMAIKGYPSHIGFILPRGRFVHTWERSGGVVIERLDSWRRRIVGFYDYR